MKNSEYAQRYVHTYVIKSVNIYVRINIYYDILTVIGGSKQKTTYRILTYGHNG